MVSDATSRNPSTSSDKETPAGVSESFHVTQQVEKGMGVSVHAGDMEVFSVVYASGSIVK
jgi:hypothetical protein